MTKNLRQPFVSLKNIAKIQNERTYQSFYKRLYMLAISRFEWEGLPETCNAEYLEKTLFRHGVAMFCKPKEMLAGTGIINVPCVPVDIMTIYEQPKSYRATAHGINTSYEAEEVVVVYNNIIDSGLNAMSSVDEIGMYAYRLMQIQRTIDININGQKFPIIVNCDEKKRLTYENLYNNYEGNTPFMIGTSGLDVDNIKAIKTDVPYLADKLNQDKLNVWNEALAFLGINSNPSPDKKERQIVSEVYSNTEQINYFAESYLLCRQNACKELKSKFDLDVTVKMRKITEEEIQGYELTGEVEESEVEENG